MTEAEELEQKLLEVEPWVRELVEALWLHQKELKTEVARWRDIADHALASNVELSDLTRCLETKLDRAGAAEHQALRGAQELEERVRAACDRNVQDINTTWDDVRHPHVSRDSILTALACPSEPRRQGT